MGIELTPERKIAQRVAARHSLHPPVDVESLVRSYGRLSYLPIPFNHVDGVILNLRTPGKEPHVVVNSRRPPLRRRFTIAHEMGHILIPWHAGRVFFDYEDNLQSDYSDEYEANAFAAELLMPQGFVEGVISSSDDLSVVHMRVMIRCEVSAWASAIRLSQLLPEGIVFASEYGGKVEFSGRTEGTMANALEAGIEFPPEAFSYATERHYVSTVDGRKLHWWKLPLQINIDAWDERSWRDILDSILLDVCDSEQSVSKRKQSINGVIGYAVSKCRDRADVGQIVSVCVQKLHDRQEYDEVVRHNDFFAFIQKRAQELSRS